LRAVRLAGGEPVELWHADADLQDVDAVVVPGGISYGDYLRAVAISAFAPAMRSVVEAAGCCLPVLGIYYGFQILPQAGLLPRALIRNAGLHSVCRDIELEVENISISWTSGLEKGSTLLVPSKYGEGRFQADEETLKRLEGEGQVVFRYVVNHN